ncbi:methanogenesis marker protein Mmp4/MtxX [Geoglobus sp.]
MIYLNDIIRSKLRRKRVAIGLYRFDETSEERVKRAAKIAEEFADVVVVDEGENTEKELLGIVKEGEVDAVVRGTGRASKLLEIVRREYEPSRIAVLETARGKLFLLAPVGVDEGWSVEEKLRIVAHARALAKTLGMGGSVAILAGGRYGDVGRSPLIDESLALAELTAKLSGGENFEIRIEDAVERDIVIAPDGISGNLIFRSMCYLGAGREYGAVYCGLPYKVVDTSRSQSVEGFVRAIALATVI